MFGPQVTPEFLNKMGPGTAVSHLGIVITEVGEDFITATMPVDERTIQPFGILHGGASVLLAETLGSIASASVIDLSKFLAVGLEINANHIRSVRAGNKVTGKVVPVHIGRRTHIWEIRISGPSEKLVCICRLTVSIIERDEEKA